jgi:hypothetical protein
MAPLRRPLEIPLDGGYRAPTVESFFPDPVGPNELSNLNNFSAVRLEIFDRNRAIAGAQVNPKAEACAHSV